jgi:hypothetical protein
MQFQTVTFQSAVTAHSTAVLEVLECGCETCLILGEEHRLKFDVCCYLT